MDQNFFSKLSISKLHIFVAPSRRRLTTRRLGATRGKVFWSKDPTNSELIAPSPSRAKDSVLGGYSEQIFQ